MMNIYKVVILTRMKVCKIYTLFGTAIVYNLLLGECSFLCEAYQM